MKRGSIVNALLFVILLFGFWLRIQGYLHDTFAFTYDVGRDLLAVGQIIDTHKIPLIGATTGYHGIFYGPTWYYILTPVLFISHGDPHGALMLIVLSGVAAAYIGFLLGGKVGGDLLGLILALLISLSKVSIDISAQIWNPNLIPFFAIFVFYLLIQLHEKAKNNNYLKWLFLGVILGIIFDLEIVFGILFLISTLAYLIYSKIIYKSKKAIFIFLSGFMLIQLPRVFFEIRHNFLMSNQFLSSFSSDSKSSLLAFPPQFLKTLILLFNVWRDTIAGQISSLGILALILVFILIFMTYTRTNSNEKKSLKYIFTILITYFLGLSFFNHDIESHYYVGLPIVYIILFSLSVFFSLKYLKVYRIIIFSLLVIYVLSLIGGEFKKSFQKSTWIGDASVYRNQLAVVNYIYKDANGQKFNSITYTPPIFDYPYQYLFQWKGKTTYGYLPDTSHQKLFYLIIEPDNQLPKRLQEWLSMRSGDGKIIYTKLFTGGIKLQKRIH